MVSVLEGLAILGLILLIISIIYQYRYEIILGISLILAAIIGLKYFAAFSIQKAVAYTFGLSIIIFIVLFTIITLFWESFFQKKSK